MIKPCAKSDLWDDFISSVPVALFEEEIAPRFTLPNWANVNTEWMMRPRTTTILNFRLCHWLLISYMFANKVIGDMYKEQFVCVKRRSSSNYRFDGQSWIRNWPSLCDTWQLQQQRNITSHHRPICLACPGVMSTRTFQILEKMEMPVSRITTICNRSKNSWHVLSHHHIWLHAILCLGCPSMCTVLSNHNHSCLPACTISNMVVHSNRRWYNDGDRWLCCSLSKLK